MSNIMDWLKEWVYNIAILIILMSLIELIMPEKKYKKFIKLILGLIFILVVIEPISLLVGMDNQFEFNLVNSNMALEQESIKSQLDYYNAKQQEIAKEQLSKLLISQVASILESNNILVHEGRVVCKEDQDGFGEIDEIKVIVSEKLIDDNGTGESIIEPVTIEKINIDDQVEKQKDNKDILLENKVKTLLSEYYVIDKEKVIVIIYSVTNS